MKKLATILLIGLLIGLVCRYIVSNNNDGVSRRESIYTLQESDNLDYGVPGDSDVLIDRIGYALGYRKDWKQATWVMYRLTRDEVLSNEVKRTNAFTKDPVLEDGYSTPFDYLCSGYDRGHLAPAADMAWSQTSMEESFYMSNISPQRPEFNRGIWAALEAWVRVQAYLETNIVVVTGPIITTNDLEHTIGWNKVVVPSGFYKVVYDETPPEKMIGFIMSNNGSRLPLRVYSVSVDEVEELTGLDFFNLIEDIKEDHLEKMCNYEIWR